MSARAKFYVVVAGTRDEELHQKNMGQACEWGRHEESAIQHEDSMHNDMLLVPIRDFEGTELLDSYLHLAYKVYSLAALVLPQMQQSGWFMKVDSDTYVNPDRLALDIGEYRRTAALGAGAWQYGGYHMGPIAVPGGTVRTDGVRRYFNDGGAEVFSDPSKVLVGISATFEACDNMS
eukprot:scaffold219869_cov42-Prasinocladus_malaysianus.AAC.3